MITLNVDSSLLRFVYETFAVIAGIVVFRVRSLFINRHFIIDIVQ
jgi:hypothetical protein